MADYNSQKTGQEVEDILDSVKNCAMLGTEADTSADNTLLGWVNGLRTALGVTTKTETSGLNTLFTIYQGLRRKGRIAIPRTFMSVSADAVEDEENDSTEQLVIAPKTMALSSATTENDGLATAMDVKNTLAEYVKKGENAGIADFAQDLTGVPEATSEEFTFRPSAGDKSIRDESAVVRRIKGNTSVWGQLANINEAFVNSDNLYIFTRNDDGSVTIKRDPTITGGYWCAYNINRAYRNSSHKYMLYADVEMANASSTDYGQIIVYSAASDTGNRTKFTTNGKHTFCCFAIPSTTSTTWQFAFYVYGVAELTIHSLQCFDLTAIYGAGNEPTTLEEFKELYPESYYPYCEPEVRSMRATGIETIGANAFDKDSVVGGLINADGTVTSNDIYTVAKIEVVPYEKYTLTNVANAANTTYTYALYDSDDRFISVGEIKNLVTKLVSVSGDVTMPLNARYIRVVVHNDYLDSCCVNLKHSGTLTAEEAVYFKEVRMLPDIAKYFPDGMHGIGEVYDEINEENAVKRFGVRAYEDGDNDNADVITDGTNTVYILEEPIITPIVEPLQLDYKVADFGTEKMLSDLPSSPFRADIVYQFNAADRIRDNARNIERLEEHTKDMATMDYVIEKIPTTIATATERVTTWPSDNRLVANVLVDVAYGSAADDSLTILGFDGGSSDYSFDDVWRIRFTGYSSALNILPRIYWVNGQAPSFDTWAICDIEFRRTPIGSIFGEWKIYR